jgi:hypothetical protein
MTEPIVASWSGVAEEASFATALTEVRARFPASRHITFGGHLLATVGAYREALTGLDTISRAFFRPGGDYCKRVEKKRATANGRAPFRRVETADQSPIDQCIDFKIVGLFTNTPNPL